MYPSIKRLAQYFGIEKAKRIRAAMEGKPVVEGESTGVLWHTVRNPQLAALHRIDSVLGTFGVEYIPRGHNAKSPAISYCNTGDTYQTTIMLINGRFVIGAWGDIVERGNYD